MVVEGKFMVINSYFVPVRVSLIYQLQYVLTIPRPAAADFLTEPRLEFGYTAASAAAAAI